MQVQISRNQSYLYFQFLLLGVLILYCDASNPPTTKVSTASTNCIPGTDYPTYGNSISYPIKKNFYYLLAGRCDGTGLNTGTNTIRLEVQPFNT